MFEMSVQITKNKVISEISLPSNISLVPANIFFTKKALHLYSTSCCKPQSEVPLSNWYWEWVSIERAT